MRTTPLTPADLKSSVVAVPPLARRTDLSLNAEENARLVRRLEAAGVRILLYGGNANFYHLGSGAFEEALDLLEGAAGPESLVIPSVGPSFGVMMEEAAVLRGRRFPAAMVLPEHAVSTPGGVETGVRRFVERSERPAVLYLKEEGRISPEGVRRLMADGLLSAVKYAVVRRDPGDDPLLQRLVELIGPERIVSGMGEQPAQAHLRDFGLGGFTSGLVSIAPRRSQELLQAFQAGDWSRAEQLRAAFRPLEDLRNRLGPIRVLHDAVTLAGLEDMGPILPLLENLDAPERPAVAEAARRLRAFEEERR